MKKQEKKKTGLELLREPFPSNQVGKLPKPTKSQTDEVKKNYKAGVRCEICGGWHHPKVVHLDYVGHAALTDRLLDADKNWNWEPLAFKEGLPAFDATGGLWIKLTVCGVTRLGYGNAANSSFKEIGSREKEVIGDALRNASMRFGAALDLWHKGDLHVETEEDKEKAKAEALEEDVDRAIINFEKTSDKYRTIEAWDSAMGTLRTNTNRVCKHPRFIEFTEGLYKKMQELDLNEGLGNVAE